MLLDEIKLPIQKRSKERLEIVIETTINILEKRGIEQCSIPEVSMVSSIPKTYIYQYFPTINHLFIVIVKRYLDALQSFVSFKSERYKSWKIQSIMEDLITQVASFYNSNKAASILILGGPVNVEGFNLQEIVIEKIAKDILDLFQSRHTPLRLEQPENMTYMVEMVFALMKHSFFKYHYITTDIQKESMFICNHYLLAKGYNILD